MNRRGSSELVCWISASTNREVGDEALWSGVHSSVRATQKRRRR
jgi:hypothetical protein